MRIAYVSTYLPQQCGISISRLILVAIDMFIAPATMSEASPIALLLAA